MAKLRCIGTCLPVSSMIEEPDAPGCRERREPPCVPQRRAKPGHQRHQQRARRRSPAPSRPRCGGRRPRAGARARNRASPASRRAGCRSAPVSSAAATAPTAPARSCASPVSRSPGAHRARAEARRRRARADLQGTEREAGAAQPLEDRRRAGNPRHRDSAGAEGVPDQGADRDAIARLRLPDRWREAARGRGARLAPSSGVQRAPARVMRRPPGSRSTSVTVPARTTGVLRQVQRWRRRLRGVPGGKREAERCGAEHEPRPRPSAESATAARARAEQRRQGRESQPLRWLEARQLK
jgi:hypothetical protein